MLCISLSLYLIRDGLLEYITRRTVALHWSQVDCGGFLFCRLSSKVCNRRSLGRDQHLGSCPTYSIAIQGMNETMSDSQFDQYANNYETALQQGLSVSGESSDYFATGRVKWLRNSLEDIQGRSFASETVMDFGCGTGNSVEFL